MFEYLFAIFAFGLVVTGIVCKGLLTATEMAKADREAHEREQAQGSAATIHVVARREGAAT